MRNLDFTSWHGLLSTLLGLALITLIGVGIRLVVMQTIQQRRERENRQINERLRTLIAAYKTLGGSFTGNLAVDPTHLRELRRTDVAATVPAVQDAVAAESGLVPASGSAFAGPARGNTDFDRPRRVRDAVEAALSDIILLGTEEQVRLAARAASELAAGRPIHTAELVVSLRNFIRQVLNLEAVPVDVSIPAQGPTRPAASGRRPDGGGRQGAGGGGGRGMGMGGGAAGAGLGLGLGAGLSADDEKDRSH